MDNIDKRILVVDDDEAIRALLFTVLSRRGFTVDVARNGAEALDKLQRCHYAVMLLDLMMPKVSGHEVMDRLRDVPKGERPTIIVLTAGSEPRDLSAELVAGTVRKPFDVELLVAGVAACVAALPGHPQKENCPASDSERPGKGIR